MKRMTVVLILGLASLLPVAHPAAAQSPAVTASQVVDAETLKAFVEGAKARIKEIDESKQLLTPFLAIFMPRIGRAKLGMQSTLRTSTGSR